MGFPSNVFVVCTHGSYFVPEELQSNLTDDMVADDYRLLKNFSDFGTAHLMPDEVPDGQRLICWFSRAIGDPNRARNAEDIFREKDFCGNKVWKEKILMKEKFLRGYYDKYHDAIQKMLPGGKALLVDIHDTGNWMLTRNREEDEERKPRFPDVCLSDLHGKSCSAGVVRDIAEVFMGAGFEVRMNDPYAGGFVTQHYRRGLYQTLQIEFGRHLYMDERHQKVYEERAEVLRKLLAEALTAIQI
ncbi:N-formylglutamate amidohydrolase [Candidatus Woesearchaeota archaeon]|nr:N-formylglutamate amidohydrolase [Candidatus Woesearchaeota archaeon]